MHISSFKIVYQNSLLTFFVTINTDSFFSIVKTQQWNVDWSPPVMKIIQTSSSSSTSALSSVLSPPVGQCTWVWLWAWGRSPSSCASQVLLCSGDTWGGGRNPPWQTAALSWSRRPKRRTTPHSASSSFWPPTAVATERLACNFLREWEAPDARTHNGYSLFYGTEF